MVDPGLVLIGTILGAVFCLNEIGGVNPMLKLLFCKTADVFDRERQFLFTATVVMQGDGEAELRYPLEVPIEEMEVDGYVTFYDDVEGLVTYWCNFHKIRRLEKENCVAMYVKAREHIDQVQRRLDLKTGVRFKAEVDYRDLKGKMRFCKAEVENISASGIFFTSEHRFTLGDSVVLRLTEISSRLFVTGEVVRIQSLFDWESSLWLEKREEVEKPKPPAPEGQNIFSFIRKKKEAAKASKASEEPEEPEEKPEEPRRMAFQVEEETDDSVRVVEEDIGGDTERYGYGCHLVDNTHGKEVSIRRFVFEQERQRLQTTR